MLVSDATETKDVLFGGEPGGGACGAERRQDDLDVRPGRQGGGGMGCATAGAVSQGDESRKGFDDCRVQVYLSMESRLMSLPPREAA